MSLQSAVPNKQSIIRVLVLGRCTETYLLSPRYSDIVVWDGMGVNGLPEMTGFSHPFLMEDPTAVSL